MQASHESSPRQCHHPAGVSVSSVWRSVAVLLLGAAGTWVSAQDVGGTRVLKGQEVNEDNLLDALTPPIKTRSLKARADGSAALAPQRKPSASLLITFETNSADLTPAAKQQLDIVAAALKNDRLANYDFSVEGHADPRGNREANLVLSQLRAESVRAFLIGTHGIESQRLKAEGKGDQEPLNRAFPAAAENRRVTIVTIVQ
jgi:OmpA-OmpF porin, OOP family